MTDPTYSFTVPSIHDDIPLDCRIYHPPNISSTLSNPRETTRGAVIAHPYAPLGGSADDACVLAVTESLLECGFFVTTFNFRGAGESAGKTSWTGRPEVDDYSSVVGLMVYYLSNLSASDGPDTLSTVLSIDDTGENAIAEPNTASDRSLELLLAGYSFGALILSRMPGVSAILERFEKAENGTAASEIFLRARTLSKQTRHSIEASQSPTTQRVARGRGLHPNQSPTKPHSGSPVVVGGEETDASGRRRSRDSRRSVEVMRDMPHNIKSHVRRHSGHFGRRSIDRQHHSASTAHPPATNSIGQRGPAVTVRYLLISPVLLPLSTTLLSPGLPFTMGSSTDQQEGVLSLRCPTLILFGSSDTFTSSKKLRQWAEKLERDSPGKHIRWSQIEGAGHFWREQGVMQALQSKIQAWAKEEAW
ncbi:Putative alpha/Beta hydrolase [Septoria linicola]|uniref:Alpha/Beta hydrolase n=1 Tax=Septoria linicola TaxID=215465 RepID=A0A9Q9ECV9_9PEZI|nr:putative alpha/Beta hydrolase [Septoria linicola]USW47116.1 Putative alpha/Beta hydrolase [Septoria linicola]